MRVCLLNVRLSLFLDPIFQSRDQRRSAASKGEMLANKSHHLRPSGANRPPKSPRGDSSGPPFRPSFAQITTITKCTIGVIRSRDATSAVMPGPVGLVAVISLSPSPSPSGEGQLLQVENLVAIC